MVKAIGFFEGLPWGAVEPVTFAVRAEAAAAAHVAELAVYVGWGDEPDEAIGLRTRCVRQGSCQLLELWVEIGFVSWCHFCCCLPSQQAAVVACAVKELPVCQTR
jgi:hypothetical protein